jgi:hypothetical protein
MPEPDLMYVLGVDPDTESLNKAIRQINAEVEAAETNKLKLKLQPPTAGRTLFGDDAKTASSLSAALSGNFLPKAGAAIGEAIGAAFGMPEVGEVAGRYIAQAIPGFFAAPARAVTTALKGISTALSDLGSNLGPVAIGFDAVSGVMEGVSSVVKSIPIVGEVLGPLTDELAAIPGIFKEITGTLVSFAGIASPGQMQLWQRTLLDVQGVIGQAFLPALALMREGARAFGDLLANILPNAREVSQALDPLRESMRDLYGALRQFEAESGPLIREVIITHIRMLAVALSILAKTAQAATGSLNLLLAPLNYMAERLGITEPGGLRSSYGAAAAPASFQSFSSYEKAIQQAAFSEGTGVADVPRNVGSIKNSVDKIADWFDKHGANALTPGSVAAGAGVVGGTAAEGAKILGNPVAIANAIANALKHLFSNQPAPRRPQA